MKHHFIVIWRQGAGYDTTREEFGQALVGHLAFIESEYKADRLLMAGPLTDDSGGMAILLAKSRKQLIERLQENPAIAEGFIDPIVHGWMPWDLEQGIEIEEIELGSDDA